MNALFAIDDPVVSDGYRICGTIEDDEVAPCRVRRVSHSAGESAAIGLRCCVSKDAVLNSCVADPLISIPVEVKPGVIAVLPGEIVKLDVLKKNARRTGLDEDALVLDVEVLDRTSRSGSGSGRSRVDPQRVAITSGCVRYNRLGILRRGWITVEMGERPAAGVHSRAFAKNAERWTIGKRPNREDNRIARSGTVE